MKNKKGFTLIELMAVIIILIVVMLMALVIITQYTKDSKEKAIRADAITFIKLVRDMAGKNLAEDGELDSGLYTVAQLKTLGINVTGREPDTGYVFLADYKVVGYCLKYDSFKVTNIESDEPLEKGECPTSAGSYLGDSYSLEYESLSTYTTFVAPVDGTYFIELWGAQGNDANRGRSSGGKGAYTSGFINLEKGQTLYVYVGEHRSNRSASFNAGSTGGSSSETVNGGSVNGYGGGGATDIRLVAGSWDNTESLASRIMVAGGGGGATDYVYPANGGYAGGLIGQDGINGKYPTQGVVNVTPTGGSQVSGGSPSSTANTGTSGSFGRGGNGNGQWGSGGGGGYYGGGGGGYTDYSVDSGAGGSSYISGHAGSLAIASSSSTDLKEGCTSLSDSVECSIHYSGLKFTNTEMKSGNDMIPKQHGTASQKGNSGNGFARITIFADNDSEYQTEFAVKFPDYDKLTYITSSGTQYINTGINAANDVGVYAKLSSNNITADTVYFGSRGSNSDTRFWVGNNTNGKPYYGWNTNDYDDAVSTSTIQTIYLNYLNNREKTDGGSFKIENIGTLGANTYSIYIFSGNVTGTANYYSSINLYELNISKGKDIVRKFVPCKHKTQNTVIGFCELVTGQFFGNNGTGTFTY